LPLQANCACRRNIYAQLTLGHQNRTDLLIFSEDNRLLRVEVKSKQGKDWPNCTGVYGNNVTLVFVDFAGKEEFERSDFHILTVDDWIDFIKKEIANYPKNRIKLDERNVPVWLGQVDKSGQPYRGIGVTRDKIQSHREKWDKIAKALGKE
jgi:hypothetical protein